MVAGTGLPLDVGEARWLKWCSALGAPGVSDVASSRKTVFAADVPGPRKRPCTLYYTYAQA